MVFLAPLVQKVFNVPIGLNAFTASIILGMMALPTVASIAEDAISSVPKSLREASFALGATSGRPLRVLLFQLHRRES